MSSAQACRPRLLFLASEAVYFVGHRLSLARRARDAGYHVAVACRATADAAGRIADEGFTVLPITWRRDALSPIDLTRAVRELRGIYRAWHPDVIHHVGLLPIVLGAMAAAVVPRAGIVNAFTGLGYLFSDPSPKTRVIRLLIGPVLRRLLARGNSVTAVENEDDARFLRDSGFAAVDRLVVVRGSGVDLEAFYAQPLPESHPPAIALVGRMLKMKGIETAAAAFELLAARGVPAHLFLAGKPDPGNPTTIPEARLSEFNDLSNVEWLGHVDDVRTVWSRAALCLQPSFGGEGVPVSLLEAAACQRGAVASDVPGCRDVVRSGVNGLLVPPGDPVALADAVEHAIADRERLAAWGRASRALVASAGFDNASVGNAMLDLYARVAPVLDHRREDCG